MKRQTQIQSNYKPVGKFNFATNNQVNNSKGFDLKNCSRDQLDKLSEVLNRLLKGGQLSTTDQKFIATLTK